MTAQEQAEKLVDEYYEGSNHSARAFAAAITAALRAARNEAIEECAKLALSYELPDTGPQDQYGRVMASLQITSAIRALKG